MSVPATETPDEPPNLQHSPLIFSPIFGGLCDDRFVNRHMDHLIVPFTPTSDINIDSPSTASISGSSAQFSDEDFAVSKDRGYPPAIAVTHSRTPLDAPPVYSFGYQIGYGAQRLLFIEQLIWKCVAQVYSIWGAPTRREPGLTASIPLQKLVHQGLVHGLCNEIVILPVMENIQNAQTGCHSADLIPFPLFMAEMLRRMRASCFLLSITMRYILDIADQVKLAKDRAQCGWCRSGIDGCDHGIPRTTGSTSRFSKGRSAASRNSAIGSAANSIPNSVFTKGDSLAPLTDPRKAFLGSLILANKFHRDRSVGNKSWATLIGLPLEEVHCSERAVGEALGWTLSRPWLSEDARLSGGFIPGPTHASFSEPLFATNDAEVTRYGIKALRESGQIPAPQRREEIFGTKQKNVNVGDVDFDALLFGPRLPSLLPTSNPPSRKGSLLASVETEISRKIAPLPNKAILPKANPIRKAPTAPAVLQPSSMDIEVVHDRIELTPDLNHGVSSQIPFPCSGPSFEFSGPAQGSAWELSPSAGKRKASQELGRKVVARCGDNGQRILVGSPSDSDLATPQLSNASNSPGDSKTPQAIHTPAPSLWNDSDEVEDVDIPELESDDIDCDKTPLVGQFVRRETSSDMMDISADITIRSTRTLWEKSGHATHLPQWGVSSPNQMLLTSKTNQGGGFSLLSIPT